jgi:TonB-dependent starch-binding outer membrane protein SusC
MIKTLQNPILILLLLLVSNYSFSANDQDELTNIQRNGPRPKSQQKEDAIYPLKKVLKDITDKHNVVFHYNSPIVKDKFIKDLPLEDLSRAIQTIETQTRLTFEKMNSTNYMIYEKSRELSQAVSTINKFETLNIQTSIFSVKGVVKDAETNEPMVGASVQIKDSQIGTSTNENGEYSLELVTGDEILIFSYLGFESQEIAVKKREVIDVKLGTSSLLLDEAVVIGYGDTRKKDELSGAVTVITSESIAKQPVNSVDQALAGMTPGVTLREGTGAPGAGPEILIRGINTFQNNKPLIVIDDIIFESGNDQNNNPLALINPEDIETVVVLKDAATKAIYGSRATAGVIIITTKKGKLGTSKVSYNSNIGFTSVLPFEKPDVLNATELAQFFKEKEIDRIRTAPNSEYKDIRKEVPDNLITEKFRNPSQYGVGTNWFEEVTRTAQEQNHNLSLSGGNAAVRYFISGNYKNQQGVVIENDFKRYSFRANLDIRLSEKVKMNLSLNPTRTERNRPSDDPSNSQFSAGSTVTSTYWLDPSAPVYSSPGVFAPLAKGSLTSNWQANPVYQLKSEVEKRRNTQMLLNWGLEYELIKGLTFKTKLNYNYTHVRSRNFKPMLLVDGDGLTPNIPNADSARTSLYNGTTNNFINDNVINYKFKVAKNNFDVTAGYLIQENIDENSNLNAKKLLDENFILPDFANVSKSAVGNLTGNEDLIKFRMISMISRLNYSYDNKYLVNMSLRRDGNSRFGRNVKFGYFPAGSVTWRISEEKFMDRFPFINDLRVEVGYGITGNANGASAYGHLGSIKQTNYPFGGVVSLGNTVGTLPNGAITWEEAEQWDIGLNLGLWKDKIKFAFNVYQQETGNPLADIPVSWATGFGSVRGNQEGLLRNSGFEADITYNVTRKKDFTWSINANVSKYNNLLVDYYLPQGFQSGNAGNGTTIATSVPGQPIGMYRGLRILGLFTAAEIADPTVPKYSGAVEGNIKYFDGNGNGRLDAGDADYVILGSPHPDLMFGFNNTIGYKGFNFRAQFAGQLGGLIYDLRREIMWNTDGNFNINRLMLDRWRPGDEITRTDFQTTNGNNSNKVRWPSDNKVYDGSYLALKNITLGYDLARLTNKAKRVFSAAQVYGSVRNVFYLAAYKYGNPEIRRANDGSALRSVNYGSYPVGRTVVFGVDFTF